VPGSPLFCQGPNALYPTGQKERKIMATTTSTPSRLGRADTVLRTGAGLMTLAAIGFIGYAALFFVRNFTDSFLELGIGPAEVSVGRQQIQAFSPSLLH
jgi:hypothetical protein